MKKVPMKLDEWTTDDITFCMADSCSVNCSRKPNNIRRHDIPHSFSDFSKCCSDYIFKSNFKIGDEVYVHGYVDEIRKDVVIIKNYGGYFGTVYSEVKLK